MENVIDNKNILNIIAEMSQQETDKLLSIFQVMKRFEKEKHSSVLPAEEVSEQGIKWLEELKRKETAVKTEDKPHNIILNAVVNRCEVMIQKHEKTVSEINDKISVREGKINNRQRRISGIENKIEKYMREIKRINTSNNFLQSILGGNHDGSARFFIKSNNRKLKKLKNRINSCNIEIAWQKSKINIQSSKIADLNSDISDKEVKISKQRQKIDKVNEIIQKDMPHAALSYFLSERSGLEINELNKAIENPKEYFKADEEVFTPVSDDKDKEELITKLMDNVKSGEAKDYGYEVGLKEIENNLRQKSTDELRNQWVAAERQNVEDITTSLNENPETRETNDDIAILTVEPETQEQLELYAQFQGVLPTINFNYTLENEKVKEVAHSGLYVPIGIEKSKAALLKNKTDGVAYKNVTKEQLEKLNGQAFIFKRDDENPDKFIVKFNESDKEEIETALKQHSSEKPIQR